MIMNLWHNLYKQCIVTQAEVKDKKELLKLAAQLAAEAEPLASQDEKTIYKALTDREKLSSTGLSDGIAIPHCSFDNLTDFVIGVITTREPIEFGALDEKPSQIFIFLIGPTDNRNKHIRLLASISKAVNEKQVRKALLEARTSEDVTSVFSSSITYTEPKASGQGKSQITVYIQKEEYFDQLLEAVSSETDGDVAVIETENANEYLYHMPLFAGFWSDRKNNFSRILIAVIDREAVNSVLRRIGTITPDLEHNSGVMVTVQDLAFALGSLDF
jgi:PTS system nitrogen regulatory IIA component